MAFLCPSRLGRNKHKRGYYSMMRKLTKDKGLDTITLEDLVKLSWTTPDSRRIILQNFTSCAPQEITVKQGQKVNYIYREGDWAYVVTDDKKEGFVPFIVLAKIGVPSKPAPRAIDTGTYTKKVSDLNPRNYSVESEETDHSGSDLADDSFISSDWSADSGSVITIQEQPSVKYLQTEPIDKLPMFYEVFLDERTNILHKNPLPLTGTCDDRETPDHADGFGQPSYSLLFKVIYNFAGKDVYDVPVQVGDIVHLLDDSDPGWFWVRKLDGTEGYVPSNYIAEIHEQSTEYQNTYNEKMARSKCDHRENNKHDDHHIKDIKSDITVIPTNWKVTNDLSGKNPANVAVYSTEVANDTKKQRPKKPPRKKKGSLDGLSPRLDESIDSIDTCLTDSSVEYLDYQTKSSCDEFSPRSNDVSDNSVFDSSFNGIYNYRQYPNTFSDSELSPRSLDIPTEDDTDTITGMEPDLTQIERDQNRDKRKDSKNDREVVGDKSLPKYKSKVNSSEKETNQQGAERQNGNKVNSVNHHENRKTDYKGRHVSCEIGDSFESKSSHGQRHKRPVSMPAFKSFQEYKKDYFDEYFYDDSDTKFSNRSKHDVVNVSEILKMRKTIEQRKRSHSNGKHRAHFKQHPDDHYKAKQVSSAAEHKNEQCRDKQSENHDSYNKPKIKQFLLNLPSTNIEIQAAYVEHQSSKNLKMHTKEDNAVKETMNQQAKKRFNSTSDVQNKSRETNREYEFKTDAIRDNTYDKRFIHQPHTMKAMKTEIRQYNSSTDLRHVDASQLKGGKEVHREAIHKDRKMSEKNEGYSAKERKTHLRPYNSSTDLREIGGKPDWSFGYPRRRTRQSIGRKETEKSASEHTKDCKRNTKEYSNRKSRTEYRTEERALKVTNFEAKNHVQNSVQQAENVGTGDNSNETIDYSDERYKGDASDEDVPFGDSAMMALLSQTDNLLHKTDNLLHHDDRFRRQTNSELQDQEINHKSNRSDKTDKQIDLGNHDDTAGRTLVSQTQRVDTNAAEKCFQFLNNSTIGIHGMTYSVTEENQMNDDGISNNLLRERQLDSGVSYNASNSGKTESTDTRKEKSNIVKDNSSKMVSAGLKSLDLKDIRGITEFVCQCDCSTDIDDMLPIKRGEILHIGLDGQDNNEQYWAFSPKHKKYGFVSKQHVKIPLVTII